jgi:hypothetical protein
MKRLSVLFTAVVVASLLTAPSASAQMSKFVWVGGAAVVPTGDSGDGLETGWWADVGFGLGFNEKVSLQLGGLFGSNDAKTGNGKLDMMGGSLGLGYSLTTGAMLNPYLLGSIGMLQMDNGVTDAESEVMFQGGGGVFSALGQRVGFFVEARYLQAGSGDTKFTAIPVAVGLTFSLGGN